MFRFTILVSMIALSTIGCSFPGEHEQQLLTLQQATGPGPNLTSPEISGLWEQLGVSVSESEWKTKWTGQIIPYDRPNSFAFEDTSGHIQGAARYNGWHLLTHSTKDASAGEIGPGFLIAISPAGIAHRLEFDVSKNSGACLDAGGEPAGALPPGAFLHPGGIQVMGDILGVPFGSNTNIVKYFDLRPITDPNSLDPSDPSSTLTLQTAADFPDIHRNCLDALTTSDTSNTNAVGLVNLGTEEEPRIITAVALSIHDILFFERVVNDQGAYSWQWLFENVADDEGGQNYCNNDDATWCRPQSIALVQHDTDTGLALLTFMSPKEHDDEDSAWDKDRVNFYDIDLETKEIGYRGKFFPPLVEPARHLVRMTYGAGVALRNNGTLGLLATDNHLCHATEPCPGIVEYRDVGWDQNPKLTSSGSARDVTVAANDDVVLQFGRGSTANLWGKVGKIDPITREVSWKSVGSQLRGRSPSIAMDDDGNFVVVYQDEFSIELRACTGKVWKSPDLAQVVLSWNNSANCQRVTDGNEPSVALNNHGDVVLVQRGSTTKLWIRVGHFDTSQRTLTFPNGTEFPSRGENPAVSVNDIRNVVTVSNGTGSTATRLYYRLWSISSQGDLSARSALIDFGSGYSADVALNNQNEFSVVHTGTGTSSQKEIYYRGGIPVFYYYDWSFVPFPSGSNYLLPGRYPSVALNRRGDVVLAFQEETVDQFYSMVGFWRAAYTHRSLIDDIEFSSTP